MQELKKDEVSSPLFINGVMHLCVVSEDANARIALEKSVDGKKSFWALTDASGIPVEFEYNHGVLFNSEIENTSQQVHYRIKCLEGSVKYEVAK